MTVAAPPSGFVLESQIKPPKPPPGFQMESQQAAPAPPPGFVVEGPSANDFINQAAAQPLDTSSIPAPTVQQAAPDFLTRVGHGFVNKLILDPAAQLENAWWLKKYVGEDITSALQNLGKRAGESRYAVPQAQTVSEKAAEAFSGAGAMIAQYLAFRKAIPGAGPVTRPLGNVAAMEAQNIVAGGKPGSGAAVGAGLETLHSLPLPLPIKTGLEMVGFGALTAAQGGDAVETVINTIFPAAMHAGELSGYFREKLRAAKTPEETAKIVTEAMQAAQLNSQSAPERPAAPPETTTAQASASPSEAPLKSNAAVKTPEQSTNPQQGPPHGETVDQLLARTNAEFRIKNIHKGKVAVMDKNGDIHTGDFHKHINIELRKKGLRSDLPLGDTNGFINFGEFTSIHEMERLRAKLANNSVKTPEQLPETTPSTTDAPTGGPTTGIAHRVSEARGIAAEPGAGISPEDSVQHGRELLSQGADPQKVLEDFGTTKAVTADGMAVVRAHGETLAKAANAAADQHGVDSPEYKAAAQADKEWIAKVKPMQTEWHKIGQAQQGETEIDTGTFHGLNRAYFAATGKDFNSAQAAHAKRTAERVQAARKTVEGVSKKLQAAVDSFAAGSKTKGEPVDIASHPVGTKMTPERVKALWDHAKANYIDRGVTDLTAIAHRLSVDFGLPVKDIRHGLAAPKAIRAVTNEMYAAQSKRRFVTEQAKRWVQGAATPGWLRAAKAIPGAFFSAKVFGHGTVGMITHAGNQFFNAPGTQASRAWFRNFAKQFPLAFSAAHHEMAMQDLERRPNYTTARRAGLANDVNKFRDEYQSAMMVKLFGKLGIAGNRGFDALKFMRQDLFDQRWESLPASLRTPEMAKDMAMALNHATGYGENIAGQGKLGTAASILLFAPKLEGSRWGYLIGDPLIAAKRFINWKNESPEARASALSEVKQKAMQAATYLGALAVNQAILSASSSDDKINFTDPTRSDWLSFKVAGHNVGVVGPMLGSIRYLVNLGQAAFGERSTLDAATSSRADQMAKVTGKYLRKKLSPFGQVATDVVTQADYQGRPMPFSSDKMRTYLRREGIQPIGYGEYAVQTILPIPAEDAIKEVWKNQGMDENLIQTYLKAIAVGAVTGGTGARVSEEIPQRPEPAGPSYKQQLNEKNKESDPQLEYFKHLTLPAAQAEYKVADPATKAKFARPLEEKRLRDSVGNLEAKEKLKLKLTPIEQTTLRRNKNKLADMEQQDKARKKR